MQITSVTDPVVLDVSNSTRRLFSYLIHINLRILWQSWIDLNSMRVNVTRRNCFATPDLIYIVISEL
jgi:hypothetical protein